MVKIRKVTWGKAAIVVMTESGDSVGLLPERWGWAVSENNSEWKALERGTIENMFEDSPKRSELMRLMDIVDRVRHDARVVSRIDEWDGVSTHDGFVFVGMWPIRPVGMSEWRFTSGKTMTTDEAIEYIAQKIGPEIADRVRPYMDLVNAARRAFVDEAMKTNARFGR